MMKKTKMVVSLVTLTAFLTACSGGGGGASAPSKDSGSAASSTGQTQNANANATANKPQEIEDLTVELFDRNNTPEGQGTLKDNQWTKWIQQEMLKEGVRVNFVTVPRSQEEDKLNVMLAAGNAPDIVFTYNRLLFTKYALSGGLADLTDSLNKYGADLKKVLGDPVLAAGVIDGKQYAIPARRTNTNHYGAFIRQDWLDKLGLSVPTTTDQLVEVLKTFKAKDPAGVGANKLTPWGRIPQDPKKFSTEFMLYDLMTSFFKDNSVKTRFTTPEPAREGFKEFMQFMNTLYKNGLISKEFATTDDTVQLQNINKGEVGFFTEGAWVPYNNVPSLYSTLQKNVPDAKLTPIEAFKNADGHYYKTNYAPLGLYLFTPKTSKHKDAVVKYLNWMAKPDVVKTMAFGIEGKNYKMDNGVPTPINADENNKTMNWIMPDLKLIFNGVPPMSQAEVDALLKLTAAPYGDFAVKSNQIAAKEAVPDILYNEPIDAELKNNPQIVKIEQEYWIKMVTADDFNAAYNQFQNELKSRGMDQIIKEKTDLYNKTFKQ
ncbi:extracellular solute-binding protein [Paenibacillus thalictri]|uniref:Extracellular solute-binding protein n=1 Tax=Paenibacillus thalictri TaxID=2527873 RepID=A0A4Q9DWR7_9BACL|nr:extracellular solute-binding protein [Paenibacillus thalictri]TBL81537.1 extracellular solute-binding protein [Paenibacillus thalictri]